jgi:hypothetical protein
MAMAKTKLLEGWLPEDETAKALGVSVRTLRGWRQKRIGPAWTEMGKRKFYRTTGIPEYLQAQERKPPRSHRSA